MNNRCSWPGCNGNLILRLPAHFFEKPKKRCLHCGRSTNLIYELRVKKMAESCGESVRDYGSQREGTSLSESHHSRRLQDVIPEEDWNNFKTRELAIKYGFSESWISHNKPPKLKGKYKKRDERSL